MKWADETGLASLVADHWRLLDMMHTHSIAETGAGFLEMSTAEARAVVQQLIGSFQAHRSFAGISFYDEPDPRSFRSPFPLVIRPWPERGRHCCG
jgi:hypothetical protein